MKKRLLSFILTICMALAMMPGMSITASAVAPRVYVGDTNVVAEETTYWLTTTGGITPDGAGPSNYNVKYDPNISGTQTLTLSNAAIFTNRIIGSRTAAIYADEDLNIKLQGNNSVAGSEDTDINSYGIYGNGTVNIYGDGLGNGALTAKGGKISGTDVVSCGIYGKDGVNIYSGAVTALGGTANTSSGNTSCGIYGRPTYPAVKS